MIYTPADDSFLLAHALKSRVTGKSVLDMGAGSGILSETALKAKAKSVSAADIDPEVIAYLKKKYGRSIQVIHSNLFQNVRGSFDIIVCNPPYLPDDVREDVESKRVTTGGKKGDEWILRFLKQAPQHLAKNGTILLLLSSLTPRKKILALFKRQKFTQKVIAEKRLFFEKLEVWEITSLK